MALTNASRKRTSWGTALIALVGLIHVLVVPEYFELATYLGLLFILNALGSFASALAIYRRQALTIGPSVSSQRERKARRICDERSEYSI